MKASDYQTIADIIRTLPRAFGMRNKVALHFADKLQMLNQRFDKNRFLVACGYALEDEDAE